MVKCHPVDRDITCSHIEMSGVNEELPVACFIMHRSSECLGKRKMLQGDSVALTNAGICRLVITHDSSLLTVVYCTSYLIVLVLITLGLLE